MIKVVLFPILIIILFGTIYIYTKYIFVNAAINKEHTDKIIRHMKQMNLNTYELNMWKKRYLELEALINLSTSFAFILCMLIVFFLLS